MFDDQQPKNAGSIPPNLPTGEPDDMFGAVDPATQDLPQQPSDDGRQNSPSSTPPQTGSSALDAGALRPKQSGDDSLPPSSPFPPKVDDTLSPLPKPPSDMFASVDTSPQSPQQSLQSQQPVQNPPQPVANNANQSQSPQMIVPPTQVTPDNTHSVSSEPIGNKKTLMWIIIIVIFVVLGIGGAWAYFSIVRDNTTDTTNTFDTEDSVDTDSPFEEDAIPPPSQPEQLILTPTTSDDISDDDTNDVDQNTNAQILLGEPLDTDADSLTDVRERDLGTDPLNWDTDGDGLDDAAEVNVWKTDPLNWDTDGDGFSDGVEVKNGYNPNGDGKLFQPPTSTRSPDHLIT